MLPKSLKLYVAGALLLAALAPLNAQRLRDYGIYPGVFKTGANNAITDVEGVTVVRANHLTVNIREEVHRVSP